MSLAVTIPRPVVTAGKHSIRVESPSFTKPFDLTHDEAPKTAAWLRDLADQIEAAGRMARA